MLDHLSVISWSIGYFLIVFYGIRYREERALMMPLICGCINLAWELNAAIVSQCYYGHVLWLSLDIGIFILNVRNISKLKNRVIYIVSTLLACVALWVIFRIPNVSGMLISAFLLDLLIAVEYIVMAKKISKRGKVAVACCRFFGDVFAWQGYMTDSPLVAIAGMAVLTLNLIYLAYCLEENTKQKQQNRKKKV